MIAREPLLPLPARPGALAWLMLAASLLMLLGGGFGMAVNAAARELDTVISHRLIVQVVEPDPMRRTRTVAHLVALLEGRSDVISVERLADAEVARLIDPYIGDIVPKDLPLPALIDLRLAPDADRSAIVAAVGRLRAVRVTSAEQEAGGLPRLLASLRAVALIALSLTVTMTGLVTALAARSALAVERSGIAVLHELGATDWQLSRLMLHRIGRDAAIGTGIGLIAGMIALLIFSIQLAPLGLGGLDAAHWITLPLLPLGLLLLALATAQTTLMLSFGRAR
jgi:cell division transport system permease protein